MREEMTGKKVVITGGGSGIGKAIALEFARSGAWVAICGRNGEKLRRAAAELEAYGRPVFYDRRDVAKVSEIEAFGEKASAALGGIDVWINNAGIDTPELVDFRQFTEEMWDERMAVDLKAVFFGAKTAARRMGRGGLILNISSFASLIPTAGRSVYSCAKSGVNSLTRTLAAELAPEGIRVVSLIPGYIRTEMTGEGIRTRYQELVNGICAGRLGEVEDLTKAALFLASPGASYITGTHLEVSGGKFAAQNPSWSWRRD